MSRPLAGLPITPLEATSLREWIVSAPGVRGFQIVKAHSAGEAIASSAFSGRPCAYATLAPDEDRGVYGPTLGQLDLIDRVFTYHPPKDDQAGRYERIRAAGRDFASLLVTHAPDSRELSLALTKVQEAVMHANAAIACNE